MKNRVVFLAFLSLMFSCGGKNPQTDKVEQRFGKNITEDGAITGNELIELMADKDSAEVKLTAPVAEVCQKKGCWMDVELPNGKLMTVTFKDYGFFVPMNAGGKTAIMQGTVLREIESIDWLRHKAEDAGKSQEEIDAITASDTTLTFVADGVIIK